MGQIVKGKKKKGRPSKADLARRAATEAPPQGSPGRRMSLRRRGLRYNVDLDDGGEEDEYENSVDGDGDEEEQEERRREKKLKLVLKLSPHGADGGGGRQRKKDASGVHAPVSGYAVSASSSENKPLKKRRIGGDGDCDYEREGGNGVNDDDTDDEEDDDDGEEVRKFVDLICSNWKGTRKRE